MASIRTLRKITDLLLKGSQELMRLIQIGAGILFRTFIFSCGVVSSGTIPAAL